MAFKKMTEYNEEKFGNFFRLINDRDYADVIFLYRGTQDVLIADTHYVKTPDYSGYVQCLDKGCPACSDGIRVQSKLFIPMLVVANSDPDFRGPKIQFWDRSMRFQAQLMNDVFRPCPNPSEFIFRVTRHGIANSVDTYYTIQVLQTVPASIGSYDKILSDNRIIFPDSYDMVCKDYSAMTLRTMLDAPKDGSAVTAPSYGAVPRNTYSSAGAPRTPEVNITSSQPLDTYVVPPEIVSTEVPPLEVDPPLGGIVEDAIEIEENVDF